MIDPLDCEPHLVKCILITNHFLHLLILSYKGFEFSNQYSQTNRGKNLGKIGAGNGKKNTIGKGGQN